MESKEQLENLIEAIKTEATCKRESGDALIIPVDKVRHWARQMNTDYKDLTEKEKDSDRDQARKLMTNP